MSVRDTVRGVVRFAIVATVLAVGLALLTPDRSPAVRTDAFVVLLGGLGVLEALRWLRRSLPSPLSESLPLVRVRRVHRSGRERPPALRQLELLVGASATDGHTAAARLRPRLAALAASRRAGVVGGRATPALDAVLDADGDEPVPLDRLAAALEELSR